MLCALTLYTISFSPAVPVARVAVPIVRAQPELLLPTGFAARAALVTSASNTKTSKSTLR